MSGLGDTAPLTARLDYLQRPAEADPRAWSAPATAARSVTLLRVTRTASARKTRERGGQPFGDGPADRHSLFDLLVGLHARRMPLAFAVGSQGDTVSVQVGTWSTREHGGPDGDGPRRAMVEGLLRAAHPMATWQAGEGMGPRLPRSGYALGSPRHGGLVPGTTRPVPRPDDQQPRNDLVPLDRLCAGMAGRPWLAVVLAQPMAEAQRVKMRNDVLAELRRTAEIVADDDVVRPLAEHYTTMLSKSLDALAAGAAAGIWRVGVYLMGTDESYPLLAALWQAQFGGRGNEPDSLGVIEDERAGRAAYGWQLPEAPAPPGPGAVARPWALQSVLSGLDLAGYVHLPTRELPGFAVDTAAEFDTVVDVPTQPSLVVGDVVRTEDLTGHAYRVPLAHLSRHAFVAGVTGAGKTNTVFQVLRQAHAAGVPFLVLEPAKTEYRALLRDATLGGALRVYTAGVEPVAPLRFNPFEVEPGTSVSTHIDLIRSVFTASFAMWVPLPQIFERCLAEVYADLGWDLGSGRNVRDGGRPATVPAPTLSDLAAKVAEVVPTLGYKAETRDELRAALLTRINSLRSGARGRMLDVERSTPLAALLDAPTVLELEGLGDDDDKAFVMGSLLVRLYEHRRREPLTDGLRHVIVVEEAHRLLTAVPPQTDTYTANPKGKFVEAFGQMLSEIRAYGQGFLIADQVPVRLAADVVKNTELKIVHRLVDREDREMLAGAMAMSPVQSVALSSLRVGDAAVFAADDDAPVRVRVPCSKGEDRLRPLSDEDVREHMARVVGGTVPLPTGACGQGCEDSPEGCAWARHALLDTRVYDVVRRTVLTALEVPATVVTGWPEVTAAVRPTFPAHLPWESALRSLARHGAARVVELTGRPAGWSHGDTARLASAIGDLLTGAADDDDQTIIATAQTVEMLGAYLLSRERDPLPACGVVCGPAPGPCRYRHAVRGALDPDDGHVWRLRLDPAAARVALEHARDRAYLLVDPDAGGADAELRDLLGTAFDRAAFCYAQHAMHASGQGPASIRANIGRLREAGSAPWAEPDTPVDTSPDNGVR